MTRVRALVCALLALPALALAPLGCDAASGDGGTAFDCAAGVDSFTACGGNPSGDWTFDSVCVDGAAMFAALIQQCPAAQAVVAMDWTGSATFAGGTATLRVTGQTSETTLTMPNDCLHGVACPDVMTEPGYTCAPSADATACVCHQQASGGAQPDDVRTYTVDGGDLVFATQAGTPEHQSFCVKGASMAIQVFFGQDSGNGTGTQVPVILTLKKK